METSSEPITLRISRLNSQVLAKNTSRDAGLKALSRDTLLDAFTVLYDECNNDSLKRKDTLIGRFVDKYRTTLSEVKKIRVNLSDFEVKNTIGRGHFGQVNVVKDKHTGDVYAMKTMRKWDSLKAKSLAFEEERDIMSLSTSPWLTSLQYAFQDLSHLYLVMEFHPGGELFNILEKQGGRLPDNQAVFYLSELIEAVHALHCMGYVHRDVKPENILLDSTGHVKLVDFGSAAKLGPNNLVKHEDSVPVGTSDYIAVEVLQSTENSNAYGSGCDYWSVGVIAYELVFGSTPFFGSNALETYNKIMNYTKYLQIPDDISVAENYINFIFSLITNQESRLNYRQILDHSLFKDTDWTSLRDQLAPFIPEVSGADDTSNFVNPDVSESCPNIENFITRNQFSGRSLPFIGFTYTNSIANTATNELLHVEIRNRRRTELQERSIAERIRREFSMDYQGLEDRLEVVQNEKRELQEQLVCSEAKVHQLSFDLKRQQKTQATIQEQAIELATAAKLKWDARETRLMNLIEKYSDFEMTQILELSSQNDTLTSEVETYIKKVEEFQTKTQKLHAVISRQKDSLAKFHQLNKKIKISAKLQIRRARQESHLKINKMKKQMSTLLKRNTKLQRLVNSEKKLETCTVVNQNTCDQCTDLKTNLLSSSNECEQLRSQISEMQVALKNTWQELVSVRETHKKQVDQLEKTVSDFELLQEKDKNNYEKLTSQIELLQHKHITSLQEEQLAQQKQKLHYETEIRDVEGKLKGALKQVEEFNNLLESTQIKDMEYATKENKLQALLERLETGVKRWETNTEEESSLQKQVEQLTAQIKELQEASIAETKIRRDTLLKLWRSEKELSSCKIEKRDLERSLKQKDDEMKLLNDEVNSKNEEVKTIQTTHEEIISKCDEDLKSLQKKYDALVVIEKSKSEELQLYKSKYEDECRFVVQISEQLNIAVDEIKSLKSKLESEITNKNGLAKELENVRENNNKLHTATGKAKSTAEKYKNELQDIMKQNKSLTETCAVLDKQLHLCDEIISKNEEKDKELQREMQDLKQKNETISEEVKMHITVLRAERKDKELKIARNKQLEQKLQSIEDDLDSCKTQIMRYKDDLEKAHKELNLLEEKQGIQTACEAKLKRRNKELETDLIRVKMESSSRLTTIHKLRESNYRLKEELSLANEHNDILMEKLDEEHVQNQQQNDFFAEREIKSNATIAQQRKLIDFLQTKLNSDKKKKDNKLFGSHKKENIPPFTPRETNTNKSKRQIQFPFNKFKKNVNQEVDTPRKVPSGHKLVKKTISSVKCDVCSESLEMNSDALSCIECFKVIHTNCQKDFNMKPCVQPSAVKTDDCENEGLNEQIRMKGWIHFRSQDNAEWYRRYARLEDFVLALYNAEPSQNSSAVLTLQLCSDNGCSSICEDVLPDELEGATESQLQLSFRLDLVSSNIASPRKSYFIMAKSESDKQEWLTSLNDLFFEKHLYPVEKKHQVVIKFDQELEPNCIQELSKKILLVGCEEGLFAKVPGNELLYIFGPECVDQIKVLHSVNLALMIVGRNRSLVKTSLLNLSSLVQCAPCTEPKLKFSPLVNDDGFLLFQVSDFKQHQYLCASTAKYLLLLKYDFKTFDFIVLRKLDTAEPVSCILFKDHSVIVGADKFFKIDLKTFNAEEFLKNSRDFVEVAECYKRSSFPQDIIQVTNDPCEYLLCFNEFGIFVDEFGHRTRNANLKWSRLPVIFAYCAPYLYISHFTSIEIIILTPEMGKNEETWINANRQRIDFVKPKCVGQNSKGIYVSTTNEIVFVSTSLSEDTSYEQSESGDDKSDSGTEFSFSSSIVNSLDRVPSDNDPDL